MQIKKTALLAILLALAPQLAPHAWAKITKKRSVVAENYPEDILADAIGLYITPRGQQILAKSLSILSDNGIQIDKGAIASWNYMATSPIDIQNLPITLAHHKTTLQALQTTITKSFSTGFTAFNNPMLKLKFNGITYDAEFTRLGLIPSLEETQFLHTANTIVVEAQIEVSKFKMGVSSIVLNDTANPLFNNGDIGVNGMSITSAADSLPLTFTIPLSISLDAQSHIAIKALRVDDNLSTIQTTWDYTKLILPAFQFTLIDKNDKHALKDGKSVSPNWNSIDPDIRKQLPDIAKAAQAYLSTYVKENGVGIINKAFASAVDVNTIFQEVNTMSPPGAPDGTTPVPYMWGLAPHTIGMTDQFLYSEINTFIEDPLSSKHIALPVADIAKKSPDMTAVDPSTYDVALQLNEGFVNRLMQLSFLRGYFNSIPETGASPLKLVDVPAITADDTPSPDQLKMHVDLDYTNDPTGALSKLESNLAIKNPLEIEFDMSVIIKSDPKTGSVTIEEGPIDVSTANVKNGIRLPVFKGEVMKSVQESLTKYNEGLAAAPRTLTTPFVVPKSIGGIPISLKTAQADPSGNIMIYLQYGDVK